MLQASIRESASAVVALGRGARRGCGLIVGPERVLVQAHVLRGEQVELRVRGGSSRRATVEGVDRVSGIALLSADCGDVPELRWAQELPEAGTSIVSLADPGSGLRVTQGSVSCVPVTVRTRSWRAIEMIEHTAPIPSGAGGGPILDEDGVVLGISALRGDPGFALAIPAATARAALTRILERREPVRLGVALASPRATRRMRAAVGLPERAGLLVREVEDGSPAARAGVRAGDLLVRLGERDLVDLDALFSELERSAAGDGVALQVVRGSDELELAVDLGAAPSP